MRLLMDQLKTEFPDSKRNAERLDQRSRQRLKSKPVTSRGKGDRGRHRLEIGKHFIRRKKMEEPAQKWECPFIFKERLCVDLLETEGFDLQSHALLVDKESVRC